MALKELGSFKNKIGPMLYNSENIREILLGKNYKSQYTTEASIRSALKSHIYSHLYVDDSISNTESYIFYDTTIPRVGNSVKSCHIVVYAFCHKDILDSYVRQGYYGNRADILCQMVEETLLDNEQVRDYGIGKLTLTNVSLYSNEKKFYGKVLEFEVPNFR